MQHSCDSNVNKPKKIVAYLCPTKCKSSCQLVNMQYFVQLSVACKHTVYDIILYMLYVDICFPLQVQITYK